MWRSRQQSKRHSKALRTSTRIPTISLHPPLQCDNRMAHAPREMRVLSYLVGKDVPPAPAALDTSSCCTNVGASIGTNPECKLFLGVPGIHRPCVLSWGLQSLAFERVVARDVARRRTLTQRYHPPLLRRRGIPVVRPLFITGDWGERIPILWIWADSVKSKHFRRHTRSTRFCGEVCDSGRLASSSYGFVCRTSSPRRCPCSLP